MLRMHAKLQLLQASLARARDWNAVVHSVPGAAPPGAAESGEQSHAKAEYLQLSDQCARLAKELADEAGKLGAE
eukprot:CAMPEP_0181175178 /NCGR_PEP_ID=MMETSP1096-20121128/3936_1 /TAXON_ID=156174 ORGANISM="Chrysochromulina ericina, Strain CCMP281" /NCGR_SAMPLE_ID=MMETSP1096 /ASSEMBLY_ACC=CAM_ASM_000453 /LENGTH=73 /DNA_ID=CAMNT_0023263139 /DNA_START=1 /DNA_END=222 /DNA_ORIENTATION=-